MDAAVERRRFTAAMTANLMNATGHYKRAITGDLLLGLEAAAADAYPKTAPKMPEDEPKRVTATGEAIRDGE